MQILKSPGTSRTWPPCLTPIVSSLSPLDNTNCWPFNFKTQSRSEIKRIQVGIFPTIVEIRLSSLLDAISCTQDTTSSESGCTGQALWGLDQIYITSLSAEGSPFLHLQHDEPGPKPGLPDCGVEAPPAVGRLPPAMSPGGMRPAPAQQAAAGQDEGAAVLQQDRLLGLHGEPVAVAGVLELAGVPVVAGAEGAGEAEAGRVLHCRREHGVWVVACGRMSRQESTGNASK